MDLSLGIRLDISLGALAHIFLVVRMNNDIQDLNFTVVCDHFTCTLQSIKDENDVDSVNCFSQKYISFK